MKVHRPEINRDAQPVQEVRPGDAQNEAVRDQTEAQFKAEDTISYTEDSSDLSNATSKSKKPKVVLSLSLEEEQSLIEWQEAHPIFCNKN